MKKIPDATKQSSKKISTTNFNLTFFYWMTKFNINTSQLFLYIFHLLFSYFGWNYLQNTRLRYEHGRVKTSRYAFRIFKIKKKRFWWTLKSSIFKQINNYISFFVWKVSHMWFLCWQTWFLLICRFREKRLQWIF